MGISFLAGCAHDTDDSPSRVIGDDAPTAGSSANGGTSSGGSSAGTAVAGSAGAGRSGAGGAAGDGGAGAAGEGGTSGADGAAGTGGSCSTPMAVESCYVQNIDTPGTASCSEFYTGGPNVSGCGDEAEQEGCPRAPDLYGICIADISTYYYANAANADFWEGVAPGCAATGGTWCTP